MCNPFVPVYSEQSENQNDKTKAIKEEALILYKTICEPVGGSKCDPRNIAMAKSYLEIAVMLAVKAVTNPIESDPKVCPADCTEHTDHKS